MPSRDEYATVAYEVLKPYLGDVSTAWKGVYRLLLWFHRGVPHIIDGDKLERGVWRERALRVQQELARQFACAEEQLPQELDRLINSPISRKRPQRQNPLGIGFVAALFHLLGHFSPAEYEFLPEEEIGRTVFPGITEAPRSRPDIVVVKEGREQAVISAKWSLRHDRLKDLLDECDYFKRLRPGLKFYTVTNEFDPARLAKVTQGYCIDQLFHVNKRLLHVAGLDGRTAELADLPDLLAAFR